MVSSNASTPITNIESEQTASSHHQTKQVIGVMSAKGGVGKSFVAGFLASGLARKGYQVGILDADFTGSSIPMLFGLHGPTSAGKYSFLPLQSQSGIKIISTNLLFTDEDEPVIWKEQLIGKVIEELWKDVEWGTLDYLLVDMPPATSEAAVAVMKLLPFKSMIIVTTPQKLSAKIVNKAVFMAQKVGIHILGVVENMAYYLNADTGNKQFIFGECHGEAVSNAARAPILAQIPLDPMVSKLCDLGKIEDVTLSEGSAFIESFLESLSGFDEKRSYLLAEVQSSDIESSCTDRQGLAEEENSDHFSSSHVDHACRTFSDVAIHLIRSRENMGVLEHPDAQGYFQGRCGDRMQIHLQIIAGRIIEARFMADGCGATLACGSMITKMACSKTLEQAKQITYEDLLTALDGLPEDHEHCAELAVMTLREAVIDAVEGLGKPRKK